MQLHEKYADQGLDIVAVHIRKQARPAYIKSYVKKHSIPYVVGLDSTDATRAAYGVRSIPHLFVIDRKGVCVWEGNAPTADMERAIKRSLTAGA